MLVVAPPTTVNNCGAADVLVETPVAGVVVKIALMEAGAL